MIQRISPTELQYQPFEDNDIINAFKWLRSFISDKEWLDRKVKIEKEISITFLNHPPVIDIRKGTLIAIQKDQIGWYLYLVYTLIYEPYRYDYFQGARIIPIFKRIGMNLDLVKSIGGINKKVRDMLKKRTSEADAILFEIRIALLWVRNGWNVNMIEEGKAGKTPDFKASKDGEVCQIECKRQKKTADYTYIETAKRQIMISHISELLVQYNVLLDIKFHIELVSLPDTYLKDILKDLIPKIKCPGKLLSNKEVDIDVCFVDIKAIQKHLNKHYLKNNSPHLIELIANKPIDNLGFTCGINGNFCYIGEGEANNVFVSEIYNAFGVQCLCDAEEAIQAKARDIKNQMYSAIKQFDSDSNGIIHIGMETFDGPDVEKERARKIMNTLGQVDTMNSNLRWVYFHFFQSYSRSYQEWIIDETSDVATAYVDPISPLQKTFLIVPDDSDTIENASHWNRQLP